METTEWMPRSGFESVGGYLWLPRLLDKVRRAEAGLMGEYVALEESGMDRHCIGQWRVKPEQVRGWVREGLEDAAIADRVAQAAGHSLAQREAWSRRYKATLGFVLLAIDADEGRAKVGFRVRLAQGGFALLRLALRVLPSR